MAKIGTATQKEIMEKIALALSKDFEVLEIASNAFGIPAVEDGEETAVKIVVSIPSGSRDTKEGWDVYEASESYKFKLEQDAIKKKQKAEEKEKKIAKDKKRREEREKNESGE